MPTGFTAPLYEGQEISFEEFVLRCSRAMDATVMLRDHPSDVLPTEDNVLEGDWDEGELDRLKSTLEAFEELDDEGWRREAETQNAEARAAYEKTVRETEELRTRYLQMGAKVEAWQPPTEDHQGLKDFILEQITRSIDFDCGYTPNKPEPVTGPQHREATLARLRDGIARAEKRIAEKAERNHGRAEWVRQLRESLGQAASV